MQVKNHIYQFLIVAMALGTAWAIRGQFGHEQGAAWAGAIGGLALVIASKREDWYQKAILVALASAIGWGVGGMISYGMVVGYGHADNFVNAFYGLSMLFVIGGLFGLLGGGLVGLTLESTKEKPVKWGMLMAEMMAAGAISYYLLVEQIGFKMTPPRSEAWSVCFGAGLAMLWHMARNGRNASIRTAIFAMLGAGFGFGFGNFLQVIGRTYQVEFNMWNVMEYSIGFFGGLGMAYGVYSSHWPEQKEAPKPWQNISSLIILILFIPAVIFRESMRFEKFMKRFDSLPNQESLAINSTGITAIILVLMSIFLFYKLSKSKIALKDVKLFFFTYLSVYCLLSYLLKGLVAGTMLINHHLYIINILLLAWLMRQKLTSFKANHDGQHIQVTKWLGYTLSIVVFLAILSLIAITAHGDIGGHDRFTF